MSENTLRIRRKFLSLSSEIEAIGIKETLDSEEINTWVEVFMIQPTMVYFRTNMDGEFLRQMNQMKKES